MTRSRRSTLLVGMGHALLLGAAVILCAFAIQPTLGATTQPPPQSPTQPTKPPADQPVTAPSMDAEPECILHLVGGRQLMARLISRSDAEIVVRVGPLPTVYKRAEIDRLEILPPVLDRYRAMRAAIDDSDVPSLMVLVDWLRARDQYTQAIHELDHILTIEPGNIQARQMRTLMDQHRALAANPPAAAAPASPRAPRPVRPEFPLLSTDDINLIKVYEIDLAKPPRMRVDRETIEDLIKAYAHSDLMPTSQEGRDALLRQSPDRILDLMFRLRAREFYSRVKIIDQPESMKLFRDEIHSSWLTNACATDRCHGGADAGRLLLYNRTRNAEPAVYTNFLILDRATLTDGTPLINYDQPHRSPLLHMALPRERSLYPHPETLATKGWKPVFTSQRDRRFEVALEWIRSMYRPRPEYPVTYTPPTSTSLLEPDPGTPRDEPAEPPEDAGPADPAPAPPEASGPPATSPGAPPR